MRSYISMWKKTCDFHGIAKAGEFWCGIIFQSIFFAIINMLVAVIVRDYRIFTLFLLFFSVISFVQTLSLMVRRLNDLNRSALNLLWFFVPLLGPLILLFLFSSKSRGDKDREFDRYHW